MGTYTLFYFPHTLWLIIHSSSINMRATHVKTFGERLSDLGRNMAGKLASVAAHLLGLLSTSFPLAVAYKDRGWPSPEVLDGLLEKRGRRFGNWIALRLKVSVNISIFNETTSWLLSINHKSWMRRQDDEWRSRLEVGRRQREDHRVWEVVAVW